ncbi:DUF4198 domain-containing protein [Formosa sediminum]|uniref:DUF4198 domain-containing protein n=1 Tax=Formosa sediminum TaxID=2594004 RepID=A0A516GM14_9FLAO|nr:DUF4198 domain-containing protein [Formosa sediminum]QDO92561.1 DUF4198 domain-containing protein [Formosa sediminum]
MKKLLVTCILLICIATPSFAHYLWIETKAEGTVGTPQEIHVFYGEYTYGVIEQVQGEAFPKVKDFTLWVVDANGKKTQLKVTAKTDRYVASFTPTANGTYTIVLDNDNIEVIDYTEYDFGIFKTHYNSSAIIQVGNKVTNTNNVNKTGISVIEVDNTSHDIKLQILFKGQPLKDQEVDIFVADNWSKKLTTDKDGYVSFKTPWDTKYVIETTTKEEVPGKFKGKDYQFIWHCATYCIL